MQQQPIQIINKCEHGYSQGIGLLIPQVLRLADVTTTQPVILLDWDLRGAHIEVDGTIYRIRTWNIHCDRKRKVNIVDWTLFRQEADGHSTRLTAGTSRLTFKELIKEEERYDREHPDEA